MAAVTAKNRSWVPGVIFWILFLGSIALGRRYWWIDAVWNAAWLTFLAVMAICAVVGVFHGRSESYRGVPRWAVTLFGGEVKQPNEPVQRGRMQG